MYDQSTGPSSSSRVVGRRHAHHLERLAAGVAGRRQQALELDRHLVVGVRRVALPVQQHHARRRERRDDVDVPAGAELVVVTGEPARQPDARRRTDGAGHLGLDVGPVQPGVAAVVELHGLGQQHGAEAVDVDAAALVDQVGQDAGRARPGRDERGDAGVLVPGRPVLGAPAVEDPVDGAERAVGREHEGGPDVAHPRVVERGGDDLDVVAERLTGDRLVVGGGHHGHRLEVGHRPRHRRPTCCGPRRPRPRCRPACSRPTARPSRCVRGEPTRPASASRRRPSPLSPPAGARGARAR